MITIDKARRQVGALNPSLRPRPEYAFNAYKQGEVKEFKTRDEAETFSRFVGMIIKPSPEIEEFDNLFIQKEKEAFDVWYKALREEYSYLSDTLFSMAYDEAYQRGHSHGYDEVAAVMIDVADFVERIERVVKSSMGQ